MHQDKRQKKFYAPGAPGFPALRSSALRIIYSQWQITLARAPQLSSPYNATQCKRWRINGPPHNSPRPRNAAPVSLRSFYLGLLGLGLKILNAM